MRDTLKSESKLTEAADVGEHRWTAFSQYMYLAGLQVPASGSYSYYGLPHVSGPAMLYR